MPKLLVIMAILFSTLASGALADPQKPNPDEAAINKTVESYVEAFNRGDAGAVADHWTNQGRYVTPSGSIFKGRKKIEEAFRHFFAENKGLQLQVTPDSIKFETRRRAVETGTAIITRPGQPPEKTRYLATHEKKRNEWKIGSVSEEEAPVIAASYEHLKDLDWLAGDWVDAGKDAMVETTYQWARDKSFLTASFTVSIEGSLDLQGTQVIGWDPVKKTIRSWVFDSKGGFGEGTWTRQGNQWLVKSSSVLASGDTASSLNIYKYVDDNTLTFQSIGREVGGAPLPNVGEVTVVRRQAAARSTAKSK